MISPALFYSITFSFFLSHTACIPAQQVPEMFVCLLLACEKVHVANVIT